ncbi:MAG: hypothetical protein HFJ51_00665 [Clostridia bacterium]|nr:hypothetical protein [Clostridia bacterium]
MSEFVALTEVWRNPELLGSNRSLLESYVDYRPDVEFLISDIGIKRKYRISRKDVGWHVWCSKQKNGMKIYAIPEKPIEAVTFFKNSKGWIGVNELSTKLASSASCLRLNGRGSCLTFKIYASMPAELKDKVSDFCWIFKNRIVNIENDSDLTWYRNGKLENASLYDCGSGVCSIARPFYPVVELPTDILVRIGCKNRNGRTVKSSLRLMLP